MLQKYCSNLLVLLYMTSWWNLIAGKRELWMASMWLLLFHTQFTVLLLLLFVFFDHGFLRRDFIDRREIWHEASPISQAGLVKFSGRYRRGGRLKMRDWNYRHHQKCRGGKCGTKQLWKAKTPAGLELSLLLSFFCFQLSSNGLTDVQLVNARDTSRVSGQGGQTFVW